MKEKRHDKDERNARKPLEEEWNDNGEAGQEIPDINADENISGTAHLTDEMTEEGEVEALKEQIAELKDKYLRQVAEFDNFRKRMQREKDELRQTAGREVIASLLDVLDDYDRARVQMEQTEDINLLKEGNELIFNKLKKTLQARGLREMDSLHADFDPELHEAITEVPAPSEDLVGKVIDNIQKGYYLNDKLIRHAKVVIGK